MLEYNVFSAYGEQLYIFLSVPIFLMYSHIFLPFFFLFFFQWPAIMFFISTRQFSAILAPEFAGYLKPLS